MNKPGFWDDPERARKLVGELKTLRAQVEPLRALLEQLEDAHVLLELADEQNDD